MFYGGFVSTDKEKAFERKLDKYWPYIVGIVIIWIIGSKYLFPEVETRYYTYGIPVENDLPYDEKIEYAKVLTTELWEGNLKEAIASEVKRVNIQDLDKGLNLGWKHKSVVSTEGNFKTVFIECSYVTENLEFNPEIVAKACKKQVEAALSKT